MSLTTSPPKFGGGGSDTCPLVYRVFESFEENAARESLPNLVGKVEGHLSTFPTKFGSDTYQFLSCIACHYHQSCFCSTLSCRAPHLIRCNEWAMQRVYIIPKILPIFTITFGPSLQIAVRALFNLTFKSLHTFSMNLAPFFLGKIL